MARSSCVSGIGGRTRRCGLRARRGVAAGRRRSWRRQVERLVGDVAAEGVGGQVARPAVAWIRAAVTSSTNSSRRRRGLGRTRPEGYPWSRRGWPLWARTSLADVTQRRPPFPTRPRPRRPPEHSPPPRRRSRTTPSGRLAACSRPAPRTCWPRTRSTSPRPRTPARRPGWSTVCDSTGPASPAWPVALRQVATLPDPVGEVLDGWVRPNGLRISHASVCRWVSWRSSTRADRT